MKNIDKKWLIGLVADLDIVTDDMEHIHKSEDFSVPSLLLAYNVLERLSDVDNLSYRMAQDKEWADNFLEEGKRYMESYPLCGEVLYRVIGEERVKMKVAEYMLPYVTAHKEAKEAFEKAEELHLMAKVAHKAQEEGGFFEKWKTLRQVRKMAGFPLERKRTGNFVARTFDLMEEARMKMREAELKMYGHNVAYKCTPDTYMKIFELLSKKYTG
ncbi:MAG: hypothetical protein IKB26_04475 [Bacteroidales bacterium]|nr:hypothetical protein [Bacteroidales bacterium]